MQNSCKGIIAARNPFLYLFFYIFNGFKKIYIQDSFDFIKEFGIISL